MRNHSAFVVVATVVSFWLHADAARADETPAPNVIVVEPAAPATSAPTVSPPIAPDPLARPKYRHHWYGWQTLTFDGVAIGGGIGLGELGVKDPELFWLGTYALAPPVVHLAHGRVGIAFADLGLRVGVPVATTAIGYAIACRGEQNLDHLEACATGFGLGLVIGYGAAVAIDAAVLAREDVGIAPPGTDDDASRALEREQRKRAAAPSIFPDVGVGQNRASVGLRGTF